MKRPITMVLLALLVATGCNRDRHVRRDPDELANDLGSKLELSEPQEASLKSLAEKLKESQKKIETQKSRARSDFSALLNFEKFDDAKAKSIFTNLESAVKADIDPLLKEFSAFHATLNTKQRKELSELLENHWKE